MTQLRGMQQAEQKMNKSLLNFLVFSLHLFPLKHFYPLLIKKLV